MTKNRMKLSPPWCTVVNKIIAMFGKDPEIHIKYDDNMTDVRLFVDNPEKADAIGRLLPEEIQFGNVVLTISIIPADGIKDIGNVTGQELFECAFKDNPVFSFAYTVQGIFLNNVTYVVFKNEIVQFFNDNLNDIYGNLTTLHQEIASELFANADIGVVYYCTDVPEDNKVGKELGTWP